MWPLEQKLSKWSLYNNYYLRLYPSQFNFYFNALSSLTSIKSWTLFKLRIWFLFIYSFCLYYKIDKAFMYKPKEHSALVSICRLSTSWGMRFIILKRHLLIRSEQLVGSNQTFFFVKLSALLLIFVKVYWLDNKDLSLYLSVIVKVYWLNDKDTSLYLSILVVVY